MFPVTIYKNLDVVYLYNTNSWFKEYVKYHEDVFSSFKGSKKYINELKTFKNNSLSVSHYVGNETVLCF